MYLDPLSGDQSFTLWRSDGWIKIFFFLKKKEGGISMRPSLGLAAERINSLV